MNSEEISILRSAFWDQRRKNQHPHRRSKSLEIPCRELLLHSLITLKPKGFRVYNDKDLFITTTDQNLLIENHIDACMDDDIDTDEETFENARKWVAYDLYILAWGVGKPTFYDEAMQ